MPRKWNVVLLAALVPVLGLLGSGCPRPDLGAAMIVNPSALNFGAATNQLTFQVSKTFSSTKLQPVVAVPTDPWIVVGDCTSPSDNCLSVGPNNDVTVRVSVLRDRTAFGTNRGQVVLFSGGTSAKSVDVVLEDNLQADFTADRRKPQAGQPVQFTDLSLAEGDIISRTWDFGDGETSEAINPTHSYAHDGVYSVSLTVATSEGQETRTQTAFITVSTAVANVDFAADRTTIDIDELIYFTDLTVSPSSPILSWAWDFGDGGLSTQANPNHQFRSAGPKTVTLTVTTAQGTATKTKENYILVRSKLLPTAKIAISQLKPYVDVPVQFNDVSDPGASPILSRVWDFDDATSSIEANPLHTFRVVGNYNVKLTVITEHGTSTDTLPVEVTFKPPTADFAVDNANPDVFQFVQFSDRSEAGSGPVTYWDWDFGDGKSSSEQNPRHRYSIDGKYTVSLTVRTPMPSNNEDTETKTDFIVVVAPPAPAFNFTPRSVYVDQTVQYQNTTARGSEPILSYSWDFDGDPATVNDVSTLQNPTFVFHNPGSYDTKLTVRTALRTKSVTQTVIVDKAPNANFSASPRTATTVDLISFTDSTRAGVDGNSKAIVARAWDFGDGSTSTSINPTHLYSSPGTYTVKLTVTYAHSGTGQTFTDVEEKTDYITISNPTPPTAKFTLGSSCSFTNQAISFVDASTTGTKPISTWAWRFGDGGTSNSQNPTHIYSAQGTYTVTLTVTSSGLPAGFNTSTYSQELYISNTQALDDFVNTPDPAEFVQQVGQPMTILGLNNEQIATAFSLYMVSQTWRSASEIYTGNFDGRLWNHNLTIINPVNRISDTGVLLVTGGNRFSGPLSESDIEDSQLGLIAAGTGCTFAIVDNVPAQPIEFADEPLGGGRYNQRTEDEILAYSFDKFLDSFNAGKPDTKWPALFPMTKAAVRAMDNVQSFMAGEGVNVEDFIVTGGSKRGWTTWLAGIADCRIRAIAPLVIDLLNIDKTVSRQLNVYGQFAPTLEPYQAFGIFDRFIPGPNGQPPADGQALLNLVDPYEYRQRARMPKLIVNSTGDEFFLPDSSQFYIGDLKGENSLTYLPNTSHGLTESPDLTRDDNVASVLTSWILAIVQDVPRPTVNWTFVDANTIDVTLQTPVPEGTQVKLYQAKNSTDRDFRLITIGEGYRGTRLTDDDGDGVYRAQVETPDAGFRAYFVQVKIPSTALPAIDTQGLGADPKFVFSTPVRVVPDVYPFP